jgi:hypothetical protein
MKDTSMRTVIMALSALGGALALATAATSALADTITEMTTHGIILILGDMEIPVTYTPDGKFSAMDGAVTGTWRVDGDKLCTVSSADPEDRCVVYPKDKKSGDTFTLDTPQGAVQIRIK